MEKEPSLVTNNPNEERKELAIPIGGSVSAMLNRAPVQRHLANPILSHTFQPPTLGKALLPFPIQRHRKPLLHLTNRSAALANVTNPVPRSYTIRGRGSGRGRGNGSGRHITNGRTYHQNTLHPTHHSHRK